MPDDISTWDMTEEQARRYPKQAMDMRISPRQVAEEKHIRTYRHSKRFKEPVYSSGISV